VTAPAAGDLPALLGALVATLVTAKALGALAQRIGQPSVLGELIAGILLGGSVLGWLDPNMPAVHALSEIGVLVLLFEIGLHTDIRSLSSVGGSATTVAVVGVVLPFASGYFAARWLGMPAIPSLVAAAALTATSVGISARVLGELGVLDQPEGRVVLGAAVLDDIIGLVILSVVSSTVAGAAMSGWGIARTALVAIGFVVLAVALGTASTHSLTTGNWYLAPEGEFTVPPGDAGQPASVAPRPPGRRSLPPPARRAASRAGYARAAPARGA
jgi:Kef-type K+ transport system membrane component KefB